jgi:signal transduction histidine kinase
MRGMRQRVELLGGTITAGPTAADWVVHAAIPLDTESACMIRARGE